VGAGHGEGGAGAGAVAVGPVRVVVGDLGLGE
jgi:hypothetical protein